MRYNCFIYLWLVIEGTIIVARIAAIIITDTSNIVNFEIDQMIPLIALLVLALLNMFISIILVPYFGFMGYQMVQILSRNDREKTKNMMGVIVLICMGSLYMASMVLAAPSVELLEIQFDNDNTVKCTWFLDQGSDVAFIVVNCIPTVYSSMLLAIVYFLIGLKQTPAEANESVANFS